MFRSLVFLLVLPFADGNGLIGIIGLSCQVFLSDGGITEEICALRSEFGPEMGTMANGSTFETISDFEDTYQIMELPAVDNLAIVNYTEYLTGLVIEVTRFSAGGCQVLLNGEACAACEVCGENTTEISVDCSVVTSGRVVECEPVGNIFFPLEGYTFAEGGEVLSDNNDPPPTSAGEDSDNPPSTTADGKVLDSPPSPEGSEGSASPQHSMTSLFIASCIGAVVTPMIVYL